MDPQELCAAYLGQCNLQGQCVISHIQRLSTHLCCLQNGPAQHAMKPLYLLFRTSLHFQLSCPNVLELGFSQVLVALLCISRSAADSDQNTPLLRVIQFFAPFEIILINCVISEFLFSLMWGWLVQIRICATNSHCKDLPVRQLCQQMVERRLHLYWYCLLQQSLSSGSIACEKDTFMMTATGWSSTL